uniref:JmjC domain-containing protein n=1 Tax=Anopheles farauti TaxID=69004 RepID=A0A182QMN7_9DIPT
MSDLHSLNMEKCVKEILSICSIKPLLLDRNCVKVNKLYNAVLSTNLDHVASEQLFTKKDKLMSKNLVNIGMLYDMVYNRLHTGQWNAVEPVEREMFTILTYVRILYTLAVSSNEIESIQDGIYLADLGLMLGSSISTKRDNIETDLLTETASILSSYLLSILGIFWVLSIGWWQNHLHNKFIFLHVRSNCYDKKEPAILKGIIDDWPAMERWHDPNYLLTIAGERTVPIEIGSQYSNDDWSQKLMKFREFIEQNICSEAPSSKKRADHPAAYLAQHDLFDQIPALRRDIVVPDYIGRTDARPRIKAWLGPKGTVSPLHTDPCHNLLCQVFGSKIILLARPEDTARLYPYDHFILSNTSQLDARQPDYERFPLARDVAFHRLTLRRGEVLYIPPGWWHYVESLSPSFSVSFWFE